MKVIEKIERGDFKLSDGKLFTRHGDVLMVYNIEA
jgi:hypothetical protein